MSNRQTCQVFLRLTLLRRGCFRACISYRNQPISNGEFDVIVLSGKTKSAFKVDILFAFVSNLLFEELCVSLAISL